MNKVLVQVVLVLGAAAGVQGGEHANCPMAAPGAHRAGVDRRHDQATGVAHEATRHHFLLAEDGGSIRLEVEDAAERDGRDRVRAHLRAISRAFAAGDFSMPTRIHDQVPPGVERMKELGAAIRYDYSPTPKGGVVRIETHDAAALDAVHEFLRFQIQDHGTGDPTE